MEDLKRFETWPRLEGDAVVKVDRSGRIRWQVRHGDHHHDARRLRNGNVLLCLRPLPDEIAGRVRGGPGSQVGGAIYVDYLVEMTTDGEVVWEYVSPHFFREPGRLGLCNWVFRAFRDTHEAIDAARRE